MKILVTGGAGFIASHIVDAYISAGHKVFVLDNLSSGKLDFVNKKAAFFEADVRDREKVAMIMKKVRPDLINHQAAQISVRNSVEDPVNDLEINLKGLLNIVEEGIRNKTGNFIFASSGGVVYGDASEIPTSEEYVPKLPISPYGVTKYASENYLYYFHKNFGIRYVALRYSNVYGPRQNPHGEAGVVAIFSKKIIAGQVPVINGTGKQTRDYVYVGDVVRANVFSLKKEISGSFNIGTGRETDVNRIFSEIRKSLGSKVRPSHGPKKTGEQKRSCLDIKKAWRLMKWKPETSLEEGIKKTTDYFRKNV